MVAPLLRGPGRPTLVTDEPLAGVGPVWNVLEPGYRMTRDLGDAFKPLRGFGGHALWPRYVYSPVDSAAAPPRGAPGTP